METRKLQQVGGGTYTVSIPKEWADAHALEAGMELRLYTHTDGSIVVRDAETDGGELATARAAVTAEDPALVERALQCAHAAGFETMTFVPGGAAGASSDGSSRASPEVFTDEQRRAARSVVRTLVGTDLVVDSETEITVEHLLDATNVSVRQSVSQLEFTVLSVHRRATAALVEGDASAPDRLAERRAEADRLRRMVERYFARSLVSLEDVDQLGVSRPALFDYYVTARALERVAGHGLHLACVAADREKGLPAAVASDVRATADVAHSAVESATAAVLEGSTPETAHEALDGCDRALAAAEALEETLSGADVDPATAAVTARATDAVARTAECGTTVAETALCAAIRGNNTGDRSDTLEPADTYR